MHAEGPACSVCKCSLWHLLGPEARRWIHNSSLPDSLRLITILSDSYIDTRHKSVMGQLQATFGPQFVGESPGREKSMLRLVREELLYFFQQVMTPDVCFMTLEPSLTSGVSRANLASSSRNRHLSSHYSASVGYDLCICMHACASCA